MTTFDLLAQTLLATIKQTIPTPARGELGGEDDDGNYAIEVADQTGRVYARELNGTQTECINLGVPILPDFPVLIYRSGKAAWVQVDPERLETYVEEFGPVNSVGPHTHERGFGLFDPVSLRRLREFQLVVTDPPSMSVKVIGGRYINAAGEEAVFDTDTADLTSHVPGTSAHHAYCKVGLNIETGALVADASTSKGIMTALTDADALSISLGSKIMPIGLVRLYNGMTAVDEDQLIFDWRFIFGATGSSEAPLTDLTLSDGGELTIASGIITVTHAYHTVDTESNAASDDLEQISGLAARQMVILRASDTARTVVVKNNANIITNTGADITLDDDNKWILLLGKGGGVVLALSGGGSGSGMTSWTLAGATGTPETVSDGQTATITGDQGITTEVAATRTVTAKLAINSLTEDTAPETADSLATYDTSASTHKRATLANLLGALLVALRALVGTGILAITGAGTVAVRTLTGTANRIDVTNGDGVSGNPTIDIGSDVVTLTGTQVLTGKTIDGDDNTLQDVPLTAIKTVGGNTNRTITRDGSGVISDSKAAPTGDYVGTSDSQTLTNKTLTTPTIGDYTNGNHHHQDAAGGGQLNAGSVFNAGQVPLARGGTAADLSATGPGVLQQRTNGAAITLLKHNFAANAAPTTGDDTGDGYDVGSIWHDTTNDKAYICLDATLTAAVWKDITPSASSSPWQTTSNVVNLVTSSDTVTVGSSTAGGKLFIDGNSDQIQLQVQGHSTQTNLLAVWQSSAGTNQITFSVLGAAVFNEAGNDADFRIESDNDPNAFVVDASTDSVGIGTSGPSSKLHMSQSSGDIVFTIQSAASTNRYIVWRTGTANRWAINADAVAETGSGAGTNFVINRYDDAGTTATTVMEGIRSNGNVRFGNNVGIGSGTFGTSATNTLLIYDGTAPSSSPSNAVQLYCDLVSGTYELRARDSAGNVSTQSPHNPQMINVDGRITDWVHKEFNPYKGYTMEVDMYRGFQLLEQLTGEKLIYVESLPPGKTENRDMKRLKNRRAKWKEKIGA